MKKYFLFFLLLIFCQQLAWSQIAFFKSLRARSISVGSASYTGDFREIPFDKFRNNSRFGSLFGPPSEYDWNGHMSTNTLSIFMNFKMKDTTLFRHEFTAGIRKGTQRVQWLETENTDPTIKYRGRSEWMKFTLGYRYYVVKRKILRISSGPIWDLGFSVSSFTKEHSNHETYRYFGKSSFASSIYVPITGELRFFKGTWLYLGPGWGYGFFGQDGNGQLIFTKGFQIGMRLDL